MSARPRMLACAMLCWTSTGCVETAVASGLTRVGYPMWGIGLVVLVGVALAAAPVLRLRRTPGRTRPPGTSGFHEALAFVGVVLLVFVAPQLHAQRVVIDAQGFELREGFWMTARPKYVSFDDLSAVRVSRATVVGRRQPGNGAPGQTDLWAFERRDGSTLLVPALGRVHQAALDAIAERLRARGIAIEHAAAEGD